MALKGLLETNRHLIIKCCCGDCDYSVRLSAVEAVERFGPETTLDQVRRRARCSKCGARGRHGHIDAWPCSVDLSAWQAREQHAGAQARGERLPWSLEESLARYQRLCGGELGGDGPVQWPADGASKGA